MKRLNRSEYKDFVGARQCLARTMPSFRLLASVFWLLLLVSCAPQKPIELPSYKGVTLDAALAQYRQISSINAVLSIEYEKDDTIMSGDASLSVSPDKLALRIYYLGFLQGEVYEENGTVKSKPKLSKSRSILLVEGLKNSLFWWNISDYATFETADSYELINANRKVVIGKDSLLPVEQTINFDNGDRLIITYDTPLRAAPEEGDKTADDSPLGWYQSRMKIQLKNHIVRINVKSYSVTK